MKIEKITENSVILRLSQDELVEMVHGKKFYSGEIPDKNTGWTYLGVEDGKIKMEKDGNLLILTAEKFEKFFPRLSGEKLATKWI